MAVNRLLLLVGHVLLLGCTKEPRQAGRPRDDDVVRESTDALVYFYSPGCPECEEVDEAILPLLYERGLEVEKADVETAAGMAGIQRVEEEYNVRFDVLAPIIVFEGRVLKGLSEIKQFAFAGDA